MMSQDMYQRLESLCSQVESIFEKSVGSDVDDLSEIELLLSELNSALVLFEGQIGESVSQEQAASLLERLNNIVKNADILRKKVRTELLSLDKGRRGVAAYNKVL